MNQPQEENNAIEEQTPEVRGVALSTDQLNDWGNETVMVEPRMQAENGDIIRDNPTDEETEPETEEEPTPPETPVEEYSEPEPVMTTEDPGEFAPGDHSFEVTLADGKTRKVTSPDDWDNLLEEDPDFGSAAKLMKYQRMATRMEAKLDQDKDDYDKQKAEFESQQAEQQSQIDFIANISNEIEYLVTKGKLPKIEDPALAKRWATDSKAGLDPEVLKQPGIKEQIALLNYMTKENDVRIKAGLKPLTSAIDAYNAMMLENRDMDVENARKTAGQQRKAAGSRVASSSPSPVSNVPKGIMVGRGGSLRDLDPGWSN